MSLEEAMEIEVKLAVEDAEEATRLLEASGAELRSPRALEDNRLFDLPDRPLTRSGRVLRVREFSGSVIVTAKGPAGSSAPDESRYKVRTESETVVPDADAIVAVLETAGFEQLWRYQKYRRKYECEGAEIVVDETPAGTFLEIEGEPDVIDRIVARLGSHVGAPQTGTYREVWEAYCAKHGREVGDMLLPGEAGGRR